MHSKRSRALLTATPRLKLFTESVIREQTRLANQYGAVNLAQGFPDYPCDPAIKKLAHKAIDADHNQYSVTWGLPALREAIAVKSAAYNGIIADPDRNVTVTCGATEAMIAAFLALIPAGKEVILFQPFYENYHPDAYLSGAKPRYVTLREPDWSIDPQELKAAFNSKTAAIIITTPHNPTGKVFSRAEMDLIAAQCQKWGAVLFSDEIYEHILYDGVRHISPATVPGLEDRTVTISSASKTFGVTGWRVGWAIAPAEMTRSLRQVHDFLTVCAATPLQHAVQAALQLPPSFYQRLQRGYAKRRKLILQGLEKAGLPCHVPQGAYYVMADISAFLKAKRFRNDADMAQKLVSEAGVACVPGYSFYRSPKKHEGKLRFCFCKKDETLTAASERLAAYLRD
jgi:aspartate/methionine/tyrosine aminotransferase